MRMYGVCATRGGTSGGEGGSDLQLHRGFWYHLDRTCKITPAERGQIGFYLPVYKGASKGRHAHWAVCWARCSTSIHALCGANAASWFNLTDLFHHLFSCFCSQPCCRYVRNNNPHAAATKARPFSIQQLILAEAYYTSAENESRTYQGTCTHETRTCRIRSCSELPPLHSAPARTVGS